MIKKCTLLLTVGTQTNLEMRISKINLDLEIDAGSKGLNFNVAQSARINCTVKPSNFMGRSI
jgi:hypothetical protein